jgi:hypothetical protein
VFIQDLPNTFGSSSFVGQVRKQFQNAFKEFLASGRTRYPVILIVTESEVGSGEDLGYSSSSRDGLTVQHLLGDEILTHRATTHIAYYRHIRSGIDLGLILLQRRLWGRLWERCLRVFQKR